MLTLDDFDEVVYYAIDMNARFRGIVRREGVLLRGPAGWGEFCPFDDYDDDVASVWMRAAVEAAFAEWPVSSRVVIPINCIIPAVAADEAFRRVVESGCRTAKVKVAATGGNLDEDADRVAAVRAALGPDGAIRVDANGAWDARAAKEALDRLDRVATGLQYAEQPCPSIDEMRKLRLTSRVPLAADELIRRAADPMTVSVRDVADIAILKSTPLGGVRRSLEVAAAVGLPCVVSSALETSIGLLGQVRLAAALPKLDLACGLGTLSLLEGDVVKAQDALRPIDGQLLVPDVIEPDPTLLLRHQNHSEERRSWWRDRASRALKIAAIEL